MLYHCVVCVICRTEAQCHVFCGVSINEGYGAGVTCNTCIEGSKRNESPVDDFEEFKSSVVSEIRTLATPDTPISAMSVGDY